MSDNEAVKANKEEPTIEIPKPIDLSFKVNEEGMTGEDLLTAFLKAFEKAGLYVAGIMVKIDDQRVAQFFGLQPKDYNGVMALDVLQGYVSRVDKAIVTNFSKCDISKVN